MTDDSKPYITLEEARAQRQKKKTSGPSGPPPQPKPRKARQATYLDLDQCMQNDPHLVDIISYDEFAGILICNRSVLPCKEPFQPRPWRDEDDVELAHAFNQRALKTSKTMAHDVADRRARVLARFHPIRAYLRSLRWDGRERLSYWLADLAGAVAETIEQENYVRAVSRCSLIGAVARIMKPGCKHDCMVIFEGSQGALKSSMLRILAIKDEWFSDALPHDIANKDAMAHLAGRWLVEMSEIAQFRRNEIETLKSFLSRQIDIYRPPYGRVSINVPRQSAMFGSTNEAAYLRDLTGNRRFWPIKVTEIKLEEVLRLRDQLWAEAVAAYENKEAWWLDNGLEKIAAEEQLLRVESDPWEENIGHFTYGKTEITTSAILDMLDIDIGKRTKADEMRIANILKTLGFSRKQKRIGGKMSRVFVR